MPDGSVHGVYELRAGQAMRELRQLRGEADRTDTRLARVGRTLDSIGKQRQQISGLRTEMRGLARDGEAAERRLTTSMRRKTVEVKKQETAVRRLRGEVRRLGAENATPNVNVDGTTEAIAEIRLLRRELRALGRERTTASVNVRRSGGRLTSAGGGMGADEARQASTAFNNAGRSARFFGVGVGTLATAATVALPAIQALSGAVVALGGSLGSAALGAGAVGIGGIGALGVGLGTIAGAGVPAIRRISEAAKAQDAVTQARKDATRVDGPATVAVINLRNAHEALQTAQENAQTAQENLTTSRRDARRALVDMRLEADRSRLSERRAALAVLRARQEWARVQSDPTASPSTLAEARLNLDDALLGRREARVQRQRSVADNRRTQRLGVRRAPTVVSAERARRDANRGVRDARESLATAGREAAAGGSALAEAKRKMDEAFANAPRGTRQLIRDFREIKRLWGREGPGRADPGVAAAQANIVGIGRIGLGTLRRLTPTLGRVARRTTGAAERESAGFGRFLTGGRQRQFLTTAGAMFDEDLGYYRRASQNVIGTLENITRASRPFLREFSQDVETWTRGWERSTHDIGRTRDRLRPLVDSAKDWGRLTGSTFHLLRDIGRLGRPSGDSLVVSLTRTFDRWDRWINTHPERVRGWFQNMADSTRGIGRSLGTVIGALNRAATALQPLLGGFERILNLVGPISQALAPLTNVAAGAVGANPQIAAAGYLAYKFGGGRGGRGGQGGGPGLGGLIRGGAGAAGLGLLGSRRAGSVGERMFNFRFGRSGLDSRYGILQGGARRGVGARLLSRVGPIGRIPAFAGLVAALGALDAAGQGGGAGNVALGGINALDPTRLVGLNLAQRALGPLLGGPTRAQTDTSTQKYVNNVLGSLSGRRTIDAQRGNVRRLQDRITQTRGSDLGLDESGARLALRQELHARRELIATLRNERTERQRARGTTHAQELAEGFARRAHRVGGVEAARQTVGLALRDVRHGSAALARTEGIPLVRLIRDQAHGNKEMLGLADRLETGIVRRWRKLGQNVVAVHGRLIYRLGRNTDELSKSQQTQWSNIADSISSQARRGVSAASAAFQNLNDQAVASLQGMGYSKGQARGLLKGLRSGIITGRDVNKGALTPKTLTSQANRARDHARGGRLYGHGLQDTIPIGYGNMAAPGEMILTRHQEARINRKLARDGTTVDSEVRHEPRRHSAPERDFARGGRTANFNGHPQNVTPAIRRLIGLMESRFPLSVSSTTDHSRLTTNGNISDHISGHAVDLSGTYPVMRRASSWIKSSGLARQLKQGIHNPNLSINDGRAVPSSFWGPATWAQHLSHLHLALAGGLATRHLGARGGLGAAGAGIRLRTPGVDVAGIPGVLAREAAAAYGQGLQRAVNRRLGGGAALPTSGGGTAAANRRLGRRMMVDFGFGVNQWPSLNRLWTGESGWATRIANRSSGAYGIPQSLPGSKMASAGRDWRTNPATQIKWGLGYIKGRYGTPSAAYASWLARSPHWYHGGGRVRPHAGNFAGGGSFVTPHGGATFTAGEGGRRERVSVRPLTNRAGGRGTVSVQVSVRMGRVTVRSHADIDKIAEKVGDAVGKKLLVALDGGEETM